MEQELQAFGPGMLVQMESDDALWQRLDQSIKAFEKGPKPAEASGFKQEARKLGKFHEYLHGQIQRKRLDGGKTSTASVRILSDLWAELSEFENSFIDVVIRV